MLTEQQKTALTVVLRACADECMRSPLGNLLESHLKVVAADALLRSGYSILESANRKGSGRLVSLRSGVLTSTLEPRPSIAPFSDSTKAKMSPDLRVWAPCRLVLELQVRSSFGSQSALFSENLFDDLRRVGNQAVDAFVLAADVTLYDALRGIKQDRRGRKAKYADVMPLFLPASETLPATFEEAGVRSVQTAGGHFEITGALLKTAFKVDRCVIGVWRAA
ncbi:MAG: hypothetical protein Q7R30_00215 [Acidobacteriota bacterium]|nr:hypothetical protein [Acidobacteriota bacterium]